MLLKKFIFLALAVLLLFNTNQLAFSSGHSRDIDLSEDKTSGLQEKRRCINLWACNCLRAQDEVGTPTTPQSSTSASTLRVTSLEDGKKAKNNTLVERGRARVFDINFPPSLKKTETYEKIWIPHFLENEEAISTKDLYKFLLNTKEIRKLYDAPKDPKDKRGYVPMGAELGEGQQLMGSMRTNTVDPDWKIHFDSNGDFLYAAYIKDEYRNVPSENPKEVEKGIIVTYAIFRWEKQTSSNEGKIAAILHPREKNIQTFNVSYKIKK